MPQINSAGWHKTCGRQEITYSIKNGYRYYCNYCKVDISPDRIAATQPKEQNQDELLGEYAEEIADFIRQGYSEGQFEGRDGKTIGWTASIEINEL